MAGPKLPIEVIEGRGAKHLTRAEKEARAASEVSKPSGAKVIRAPSWLPKNLQPEFNEIRAQLVSLGIFEKIDRDTLARYLIAVGEWRNALAQAQKSSRKRVEKDVTIYPDADLTAKWSAIADRYFKQCQRCASDLGMTITSRCRLVVPGADKAEEENPLEMLKQRYRNA